MKRNSFLIGGVLGGLTALVVSCLNILGGDLLSLPNIPFAIFDWMARNLPGGLVVFFIETMVSIISRFRTGQTAAIAKQVEQTTAVITFIVLGIVFGLVLVWLGRRRPGQLASYGTVGGLILLVLLFLVQLSLGFPAAGPLFSAVWLAVNLLGWGRILARLVQYLALPVPESALAAGSQVASPDPSRRQFLYLVGIGSFTILVSAVGVSLASANKEIPSTGNGNGAQPATKPAGPETLVNAATTSGPAQSPPESVLAARIQLAPGARPELTSNDDFYRVDINTAPPQVDGSSWRLKLTGLVNHPLQLTLDQIRSRPAVNQAITLECISNEVGGDLISTALWTGVRLKDILADAGLKTGAKEIYITAADGFYESVPMSEAMDDRTLLVYEMNGQPLQAAHGYPLRIYIPNRHGMKQPKWITQMEVIDHEGLGYWVERGWSKDAIPHTTSVIDTVATDAYNAQTGRLPIGGIAYAGARGISKVEVQVDNGPWQEAALVKPPLSPLTWVEWRYDWLATIGQHTFRVRATDGAGQLQTDENMDTFPDGATGLDSRNDFIPVGKKG